MDPRDLKAASKYVNNLLASRGLLRGKEIAFYKPSEDESTPSKIINLIHELLTRRDKEEEQRETLALTLRTLRTNEDKQAETIQQLKTKNADLERKNALLESVQRNSISTLRTTEATARQLKDEATRIRTTISQVRTQCANDIRKRDVQIQKMKERLLDNRARGARAQMAQCTVIGGPTNLSSSLANSIGSSTGAAEDSTSLAQDTTDFLTKLSQDLADENDNLIALVRTTLSTLKAIQGLPDDDHFLPPDLPVETELEDDANPVVAPPANFDELTAELDSTLYSLKGILNQPNYVPLEDLAERDAEIERLTTKNVTLEEEWRKAIALVDGWNKTLGAKFAEVTQEEGMKSPKKTPGKGKGRALADIIHDGGREEEPEELEEETVVVMGRRELRSELSIVQEEAEEEEEVDDGGEEGLEEVEEVEEVEEEEEEEEEASEVSQPPVRIEKKQKSPAPGPTVKTPKPAVREAIAPRPRTTPSSSVGKGRRKQTKATRSSVEEAAEEAAGEAAVEEQILAEVHATPSKTPAKPTRKTPARKGKRTVRISEAAPEMFSADEIATEAEEVHVVQEKAGQTPGRKGGKQRGGKKDAQPKATEVVHEEAAEEPQQTPAKKGRRTRKDDQPEAIQEPVTVPEVDPVPEVQKPSARKRARAGSRSMPGKEAVPETQVSPVKSSRKRKAVAETLEERTQDSVIMEDAPQGRERKRRARKEDVMSEAETAVQDAEPQASQRGRRARRGDVTLEADTTDTAIDTISVAQDEEPAVPMPLVLGRKDRWRRRPSQARTDMDELLELALILPDPSPEPEIFAEEVQPSRRRERRSRTREEDDSMAEDTFARLATRDESAVETPRRNRRPSRSRKEVQEDSAMLDELAAEPVLLHYQEVSNETRVVGVKNHGEAGGKLSRARRRSLRNRDKYPVSAKTVTELTPKKLSEVRGRTKRAE